MDNRKRSGMVTAILLWAVVLNVGMQLSLGPNVMAANVFATELLGNTSVYTSSCDASVGGSVPGSLDVTTGDNVLVYYNVSWADYRAPNSVKARHEFWFDVAYGPSFREQDGTRFNTTGNEFGSDSFLITVPSVSASGYIYMNWTDAIDVNNGTCVDTTGDLGKMLLY